MGRQKENRQWNFRSAPASQLEIVPEAELAAGKQLKTGRWVLGRLQHHMDTGQCGKPAACRKVARELIGDWGEKCLVPKSANAVASQIEKDHAELKTLKKYEGASAKPPQNLPERVPQFTSRMATGYGILSNDQRRGPTVGAAAGQQKMPTADHDFYVDNCGGGRELLFAPSKDAIQKEEARKKRRQVDAASLEKARGKEEAWSARVKPAPESDLSPLAPASANNPSPLVSDPSHSYEMDDSFQPSIELPDASEFPPLPVRTSRLKLNENIARAFVECVSEFSVSEEHARGMFVKIANACFNQTRSLESDFEGEIASRVEDSELGKKRRRVAKDLTYRFPSASALRTWLTAANIMSLKHVAETLKNREEDKVATLGFDSTTKAAGHRLHDVQTTRITVRSTDDPGHQQIFTLGLLGNLGHAGKDAARSLQHAFQGLALLCDSTQGEMQGLFDFHMADRGPDVDTALDVLGVIADRRLKCCPHMLLAIDEALDKTFREHEGHIGSSKLLDVKSKQWTGVSKSTSVMSLVLLACTKLLSPSHAGQSISLYGQFCDYLKKRGVKNNFKGFVSNRFGRKARMAIEFLKM